MRKFILYISLFLFSYNSYGECLPGLKVDNTNACCMCGFSATIDSIVYPACPQGTEGCSTSDQNPPCSCPGGTYEECPESMWSFVDGSSVRQVCTYNHCKRTCMYNKQFDFWTCWCNESEKTVYRCVTSLPSNAEWVNETECTWQCLANYYKSGSECKPCPTKDGYLVTSPAGSEDIKKCCITSTVNGEFSDTTGTFKYKINDSTKCCYVPAVVAI